MVSEEGYKSRQVCPCGRGEYEQISHSGDSVQENVMLCPHCKDKYVYDQTGICRNRKVLMRPRGWVLKTARSLSVPVDARS